MVEILMGEIEEDVNPFTGRVMHKRLDVRKPERMWEEASFETTESERVPSAYFVLAEEKLAIERLRAHGIGLERLPSRHRPGRGVPDRLDGGHPAGVREPSGADGDRQVRVTTGDSPGTYRVPMSQPLARWALYLLEPRSNDSLVTWNVFDEAIKKSQYPVLRTRN
jgi:hypothetical protein